MGEYALAWGEELAEQYRIWQHKQDEKRVKHVNELSRDAEPEVASKKIKRENGTASASASVGAVDVDKMEAMFRKNTFQRLTKPVLQDFLRRNGVTQSGLTTKVKLIEAVENYFFDKLKK